MFSAICDQTQAVATVLSRSGESPILFAEHLEDKGHMVAVWLSNDGSMTVTQTVGNTTCILAVGINSIVSKEIGQQGNSTTYKSLNYTK